MSQHRVSNAASIVLNLLGLVFIVCEEIKWRLRTWQATR